MYATIAATTSSTKNKIKSEPALDFDAAFGSARATAPVVISSCARGAFACGGAGAGGNALGSGSFAVTGVNGRTGGDGSGSS
jgi:hypothetical protein